MKLELIGRRYSITLVGVEDSRMLTGGSDYYAHDELQAWWKGAGIIQGIDGTNPRVFTFVTQGHGQSFEDSVLRVTIPTGGYFYSTSVAVSKRLVDREGLIDFFAREILKNIDEKGEVTIPIPTYDDLMAVGAITDDDGNVLLSLAP